MQIDIILLWNDPRWPSSLPPWWSPCGATRACLCRTPRSRSRRCRPPPPAASLDPGTPPKEPRAPAGGGRGAPSSGRDAAPSQGTDYLFSCFLSSLSPSPSTYALSDCIYRCFCLSILLKKFGECSSDVLGKRRHGNFTRWTVWIQGLRRRQDTENTQCVSVGAD